MPFPDKSVKSHRKISDVFIVLLIIVTFAVSLGGILLLLVYGYFFGWIIGFVCTAILLLAVLLGSGYWKKFFRDLASDLNASISQDKTSWAFFNLRVTLSGNFQGNHYTIEFTHDNQYYYHIIIDFLLSPDSPSNLPEELSIRKENVLDEVGKSLSLEHEVEIGDMEFDRKYFISAKDQTAARSYLKVPAYKKEINSIFELLPISRLYFNKNSIKVYSNLREVFIGQFYSKMSILKHITPDLIKQALTHLSVLSNAAPHSGDENNSIFGF